MDKFAVNKLFELRRGKFHLAGHKTAVRIAYFPFSMTDFGSDRSLFAVVIQKVEVMVVIDFMKSF